MTKPKPKNELKAYRGKQSYLAEEQIRELQTNTNITHMIGKLQQQVQYLEKYYLRNYLLVF